MSTLLTVRDETTSGETTHSIELEFPTERITVRELIRSRVFQEVKDYNAAKPKLFRGLVQPTDAERELNGFKLRKARKIDWEEQYEKAIQAFDGNQVVIIVNDEQVENLEQEIVVATETVVSFLKLVPLVGG